MMAFLRWNYPDQVKRVDENSSLSLGAPLATKYNLILGKDLQKVNAFIYHLARFIIRI